MSGIMGLVGIGASIIGGGVQAQAAGVQAQAAQTQIQGQIMSTIAKAFGMQVEAQQYEYQSNVAQYKKAVALFNSQTADQNAAYERDVGEISAQQSAMKTRADLGQMKAQQGASGIDVNSGSSVDVRESMIELGQYDEAMIRSNAAHKAYAFQVEGVQDRAQADLYQYESSMNLTQKQNALTAAGMVMDTIPLQQKSMALAGQAGQLGAETALVNTVGSVASKWTQASSAFGSIGSMFTG